MGAGDGDFEDRPTEPKVNKGELCLSTIIFLSAMAALFGESETARSAFDLCEQDRLLPHPCTLAWVSVLEVGFCVHDMWLVPAAV